MNAVKVRTIWKVDQDTIDYGEHRYDIGYVEQEANGGLGVILDTYPFENRLYCHTNNNGNWIVADDNGKVITADKEIMEVLAAIQSTFAKLM